MPSEQGEETEREKNDGESEELAESTPSLRWWESQFTIALMTGVLGITVPLATLIHSHYAERTANNVKKTDVESQLRLQREQQAHELQLKYFDRAIDAGRPPHIRYSVLKFLAESERVHGDMREWAKLELPAIEEAARHSAQATQAALSAAVTTSNIARHRNAELAASTKPVDVTTLKTARADEAAQAATIATLAAEAVENRNVGNDGAVPRLKRCPQKSALMANDLRSGVAGSTGNQACQTAAKQHYSGDVWVQWLDGNAFQCVCRL